ncbi:hypothetical protein RRG08_064119, partial [Elysia crispata]
PSLSSIHRDALDWSWRAVLTDYLTLPLVKKTPRSQSSGQVQIFILTASLAQKFLTCGQAVMVINPTGCHGYQPYRLSWLSTLQVVMVINPTGCQSQKSPFHRAGPMANGF